MKSNVEGEDLEYSLLVRDEIEADFPEYEKPVRAARKSRWNARLSTFTSATWVLLSVWSILTARRVLTNDFPYPICFLVLLQAIAYLCVLWFVLLILVGDLLLDRRRSCPGSDIQLSMGQKFFIFARYSLTVYISMAALICSAEALMYFTNFSVLVMLPVLVYAIDSMLLSFAYSVRLLPRDSGLDVWIIAWAVNICVAVSAIVSEDYRLSPMGVIFAIAGITLTSLSRLIAAIGPQIPRNGLHTWDCSYFWFLWAGMPPCMCLTAYAASKFEDIGPAFHIIKSWDISTFFANVAPGALTHLLSNTPLRATLPLSATEGAAYQFGGENVIDAIEATLQVSALLIPLSTLYESNLIDCVQILAFVFIFVISIGPRQISLYPPRLISFLRRRPQDSKWYAPWHNPAVISITTVLFALLATSIIFYCTNIMAFEHSSKSWPSSTAILDSSYRAPTRDRLGIVIAHSAGDPIEGVSKIVSLVTGISSILAFNPHISIYTKEPSEDARQQLLDATGFDARSIKSLKNTGGVTATYLQHILTNWDTLPTHNMFFSSSPSTTQVLPLIASRLTDFWTPPSRYPSAENMFPATGFLNLGDSTTCSCHSCHEANSNWTDTFELLPSMYGASHPSQQNCQSVLLTHGNNFIASASRLRLKKDIWETLYEALTDENIDHAWAHDKQKIGLLMEGQFDSLEKPFLGYTIERLWAILLQCSSREIAWRCPNLYTGWRKGGEVEDCGCID